MSGRALRLAGPLVAATAILLAPGRAAAHLVGVEFGDLYAGSLHLLTGVAYLAALAGLALLAGQQSRDAGRWAMVAVPPALFAGALGASYVAAAMADTAVLAFAAVAGALAALGARLAPVVVAGLSLVGGLAIGVANGAAAVGAPVDAWLYAGGVAAAGGVLATLAVALARAAVDRGRLAVIIWRVWGSWIAAIGAVVMALGLARAATIG